MSKTGIVVVTVGVVTLGVVTYFVIKNLKNTSSNLTVEETLEACFGEPMQTSLFTIDMAKRWLKNRADKLKENSKALIMKATYSNLLSIGIDKQFKEDYSNVNYLIIALVDTENESVVDSVLVRYDELEDNLEKLLEQGDGTVIITG